MEETDPVCTFTAGMTAVVWKIAQALAKAEKAPDLTNVELLGELEAAPHDVGMVLKLLCQRKGNGARVMLRVLVQCLASETDGQKLELRRLPTAQLPAYLQDQDRVYIVVRGQAVLRRLVFRRSHASPFEEC